MGGWRGQPLTTTWPQGSGSRFSEAGMKREEWAGHWASVPPLLGGGNFRLRCQLLGAEEVYLALLSQATGLGWVTASVFTIEETPVSWLRCRLGAGMTRPVFSLTSYLEKPRDLGVLRVQFPSSEDGFAFTAPRPLLRKQEWGDPELWRGC